MTFSPKQMSQRVTLSVGENCLNKAPTNSTCFLKKALGALNFRNFSFPNSLGRKLLKLVLPKWRKLTGFFRQLRNFCQSCCLRFLSVPRRSWCSTSRWTSADGRKLLCDESRQVRKFQEHMNTWTHHRSVQLWLEELFLPKCWILVGCVFFWSENENTSNTLKFRCIGRYRIFSEFSNF